MQIMFCLIKKTAKVTTVLDRRLHKNKSPFIVEGKIRTLYQKAAKKHFCSQNDVYYNVPFKN